MAVMGKVLWLKQKHWTPSKNKFYSVDQLYVISQINQVRLIDVFLGKKSTPYQSSMMFRRPSATRAGATLNADLQLMWEEGKFG